MKKSVLAVVILSIFMLPSGYAQQVDKTVTLDSIVIEGKIINQVTYIPSTYINMQQLRSSYSNDIGGYLRSIPNVSGIRRGGASLDPVVRGYKYSQLNVVLNNGIKIENGCPNRMDPVTSHIETEDVENMEVIKGPYLLRYGPSFGGVINLVTENLKSYEKFEVHADALMGYESNWKGEKFHGSLYGGNSKVFFLLSGGYRNYGNYTSGTRKGENTSYKTAFNKYNYSAKLGYAINSDQRLVLSYTSAQGRDVMFPALPMDELKDDTKIMSLDYTARNLSPVIQSLEAKLYRTDVNHVMDNSNRPSYSLMHMVADVDATNTGGRAGITMQMGKHHIFTGLDYEHIEKDGQRTGTMEMMGTISTNIKKLWYDALIRNVGIFGEYRTYFSSFELNASIRGDVNKATSGDTLKIENGGVNYFNDVNSQFYNLSLSVGITKKINQWLDVSLALGRGTRSPNMLERYIKLLPVGYDRYDYLGNPQLKPETNNEVDLTFQVRNENSGNMYVNFFYSYVQDYITANLLPPSVVTPQSQGVLGVKQFSNTNYITSRGFEFGYQSPVRYKLGGG
ncbi:TonB-dependent receptor plug domain-containing protein, partial [Bacteroidota bacterium]